MSVLAGVLAAAAVLVLLQPAGAGRLASAVGRSSPQRSGQVGRSLPRPRLACALGGLGVAVVLGGVGGAAVGVVVAVAGPRALGRLETGAVREQRERLLRDLPLLLDLLASCLAGGASLPAAAAAVARAVEGPAGERLSAVHAALSVGAPPEEAWTALAGPQGDPEDPLAPAARALARAADGGAPVAAAVGRLAADARADARGRAEQGARRVGVLAVAPLGLCFLPAFLLLGVVPVVLGIAGPLLQSS